MQSKANEVSLLPYAWLGDAWTLGDEAVLALLRRCRSEGTFERVFCEGTIQRPEDFLAAMKRPENVCVLAYRGVEAIGFAWLNGLSANHGFAHFCFVKSAWGALAEQAGQMILEYWMSFESEGVPVLDVIIGTPPENGPAANFAERLGFVRLGAIPNMVRNAYTGRRCAAVVLYYPRR